jgi:hypothetical protein
MNLGSRRYVEVPCDKVVYRDVVYEVVREVIKEVPQPVEKIQYRCTCLETCAPCLCLSCLTWFAG